MPKSTLSMKALLERAENLRRQTKEADDQLTIEVLETVARAYEVLAERVDTDDKDGFSTASPASSASLLELLERVEDRSLRFSCKTIPVAQ